MAITQQLVADLTQKAKAYSVAERSQQQLLLTEAQTAVDSYMASKKLGALDCASKLSRLHDKLLHASLISGISHAKSAEFVAAIGLPTMPRPGEMIAALPPLSWAELQALL